jgi:hypothetical protein
LAQIIAKAPDATWDREACVKFTTRQSTSLLSLIAEQLDCEESGEKQTMYEHMQFLYEDNK